MTLRKTDRYRMTVECDGCGASIDSSSETPGVKMPSGWRTVTVHITPPLAVDDYYRVACGPCRHKVASARVTEALTDSPDAEEITLRLTP